MIVLRDLKLRRGIKMLFQHNPSEPIGIWDTLREDARGRTKDDVAGIRHIYLDLDERGEEALK